jgi:phage gp36-like protein
VSYCTLADMISQFGTPMLVEATDRGETATGEIDEAAIARAIASADALIDGYLAGRYALPLVVTPAIVQELSMTIALYKAHPNVASEKVRKDYEDALKTLAQIASGVIRLSVEGIEPEGSNSQGARITETERPMTVKKLKGFY